MYKRQGIYLHGDNRTGAGDGDDEKISVDLDKLPVQCEKVIFALNIYDAVSRKQTFSKIKNAYIRILDVYKRQQYDCGKGLEVMENINLVKHSYKEDCIFLLKDLTDKIKEITIEEKEKLIRSGVNYSEIISKESIPSEDIKNIFLNILNRDKNCLLYTSRCV